VDAEDTLMPETLYMETTGIEVIRTCSEIEQLLLKRGATEIWKGFKDGNVESIEFILPIEGRSINFKLPFRWQYIQEMARAGKTRYRKTEEEEQARKVAARLVLRWVESQFALIDTGMVKIEEVFLPYIAYEGITYFEHIQKQGGVKALSAGKK